MLLWVVKHLNFMVIRQFDILSSYVKGIISIKEASNKDYIDIYDIDMDTITMFLSAKTLPVYVIAKLDR
jgi:hypothetical protein